MKRRQFIGLAFVPFMSGCALFRQDMTDEDKIALASRMARTASRVGALAYLADHHDPGTLLAFRVVVDAMTAMLDDSTASWQKLQQTLSKLPLGLGDLSSSQSSVYWATGVEIVSLGTLLLDIKSNVAATAVTSAVRDGLQEALSAYPEATADIAKAMTKPTVAPPNVPNRAPVVRRRLKI